LYVSDVLATSYHCVQDTGVYSGDEVAIFGAGPIGQMAGIFALENGASKIIFVDTEPRLSFVHSRWPAADKGKVHLVDYKKLSSGITSKETVVSKLKELCGGRGPDVALECAAGEYAKGWAHWVEMAVGAETDTSEIINEMVESVRNYGRCGVTGVYVGYVRISRYSPSLSAANILTDEPLQHWLSHAARHQTHRKRPGTRSHVLARSDGQVEIGKAGSSADGFSSS
jgi:threonine dehydrogenase-like Zn-dependent dehydrogenase